MKRVRFFIFLVFGFAASFAGAPPAYLKDLEELGYCVIPEVLSPDETQLLYQRVWHEYIEQAWPNCKMDDRSNWKEAFPMHTKGGVFSGSAGQIQVMWDLRQDPRIVDVFAQIWNTGDLIVSMDGLSIMCPQEIREGEVTPWPHVDQGIFRRQNRGLYDNNPPADFVSESSLRTAPFTIQGQFLFEDSFEGDGGFYCIPKSHLRFNEFAPQLEVISTMNASLHEQWRARVDYLNNFFSQVTGKHITAPRGSLILWDSRTVHWNQHASKSRPFSHHPKVRMVGYLCYVPKARLTDEGRALRKEAFETGISTGHNPGSPLLRPSKPQQGYEQFLEDPSYTQPQIHLTPLGESLLGY